MDDHPSEGVSPLRGAAQTPTEAASASSLAPRESNGVGSHQRGNGRGAPRARRAGGPGPSSSSRGAPTTRAKPFTNRSTVFNNAPDKGEASTLSAFTGGPAEAAKRNSTLTDTTGMLSFPTQSFFGNSGAVESHQDKQEFGNNAGIASQGPKPSMSAFSSSAFAAEQGQRSTPSSSFAQLDASIDTEPEAGPSTQNSQVKNALGGSAKDDEERKKRFENLPSQNRFFELKGERDALRARYIREGVLPDPDKPQDLAAAQNLRGTCQEMCPDFEREEREFQNEGDTLEMFPGTSRIDPQLAVKIYRRPAAGRELPLPEDVRPPVVLRRTLDYLVHQLLPEDPSSSQFTSVQPFMWNRTRAIRQDFIVQSERGALTIECHERIARYHILCLHWKGGRGAEGWSEQQELEQLRKTIRSLTEFYGDLRQSTGRASPNEAEFRAYNLLLHMHDPETLREAEMLPAEVFDAPSIQAALRLRAYAQRSNNVARRGRPSNTEATLNLWTRFFQELKRSNDVSYLLACLAENTFTLVRAGAAKAMGKAYQKMGVVPVDYLRRSLGMDNDEETKAFCLALHGEEANGQGNVQHGLKLYQASDDGTTLPKAPFSEVIVEAKRGKWSCQDIIDGRASGAAPLLKQIEGEDLTQSAASTTRPTIPSLLSTSKKTVPATQNAIVSQPAPMAQVTSPFLQQTKSGQSTSIPATGKAPGSLSSSTSLPPGTSSFSSLSAKAPSFAPSQKPPAADSAFGGSSFGSNTQATNMVASSAFTMGSAPMTAQSAITKPRESPTEKAQKASTASFSFGSGARETTMPPPSPFSTSEQKPPTPGTQSPFINTIPEPKGEAPSIEEVKQVKFAVPGAKEIKPASFSFSAATQTAPSANLFASKTESPVSIKPPLAKIEKRSISPPLPAKTSTNAKPVATQPKRTVDSVVSALSKKIMAEFIHSKVLSVSDQACRREERKRRKWERSRFVTSEVEALRGDIEDECVEEAVWQVASEALAEEARRRWIQETTMRRWFVALDAAKDRKAQERRLLEVRAELEKRRICSSPMRAATRVTKAFGASASLRKSLSQSRIGLNHIPMNLDASERDVDEELRHALLEAEKARQDLWKPNTFQDGILHRLVKLVQAHNWSRSAEVMRWTVAVATASDEKTSDWLYSKLGLQVGMSMTEVALSLANRSLSLAIMDAENTDWRAEKVQSHLGLVIFELDPFLARGRFSSAKESEERWERQRQRLLVFSSSDAVRRSAFAPRLLVLSWSCTPPSERERTRKTIYARLGLSAMEQERAAWTGGVAFAELGNMDTSPPDLSFGMAIAELFGSDVGAQKFFQTTGGRRKPELAELVAKVRTPWSTFVRILQDAILGRLRKLEGSKMALSEACEIASRAFIVAINLGNIAIRGLIDLSDFATEKDAVVQSTLIALPTLPPASSMQTSLYENVDELLRMEAISQIDEMIHLQEGEEENHDEESGDELDSQHDLSALELIRSLAWSQMDGSSLPTPPSSSSQGKAGPFGFALARHLERLFSYVVTRLEEVWIGVDEERLSSTNLGGNVEEGEMYLVLIRETAQKVERLGQQALLDLEQELGRAAVERAAPSNGNEGGVTERKSKKRGEGSMSSPSPSPSAAVATPEVQREKMAVLTTSPPSKRKKVEFSNSTARPRSAAQPKKFGAESTYAAMTTTPPPPKSIQSLRALMDDAKKLLSSSSSS